MPHVTFIHGIANKPEPDTLLRIWRNALARAPESLPLGNLGVTSSMVYWADLLYAEPEPDSSAFEGVRENTAEAIDAGGGAVAPEPRTPEEAAFLESLRARMTDLDEAALESGATPAVPAAPQGQLERVPLPWFIKRRFLDTFLRDVHYYLFNATYAPPGKPPVPIRTTIRQRFIDKLAAAGMSKPHVVVSHSMGTVIAYDCLKRVAESPAVDGLITIGSPLGLDEVQDKLQPGWTRRDGFPHERVTAWVNQFDRLDPVCGFDPKLSDDFERDGGRVIDETAVHNDGAWRHSSTKYLRQPVFCRALRTLLQIGESA
jgi:hypothetical protein